MRGDFATKGSDIASAASIDPGALQGYSHDVTGTTNISALGTVAAGIVKVLKFEGVLNVVHNATSLILKYGQNHLTTDGDVIAFMSEGSGNWREIWRNVAGGDLPPGFICPDGGTAAPAGWLHAYGQVVSRTVYAALFARYSTTYNTGGEAGTDFRLPDLRGRSVFGDDDMGGAAASRITNANSGIVGTTLGASGGDERLYQHLHAAGTLAGDNESAHTHGAGSYAVAYTSATGGATTKITFSADTSATANSEAVTGTSAAGSAHGHTVSGSTANTGGNTTSQNIPPALILNYAIKT